MKNAWVGLGWMDEVLFSPGSSEVLKQFLVDRPGLLTVFAAHVFPALCCVDRATRKSANQLPKRMASFSITTSAESDPAPPPSIPEYAMFHPLGDNYIVVDWALVRTLVLLEMLAKKD